ncbi:MAG: ATP-dependent Clp protease proteolytic subunit [Myxococcota bacterium]
MSHVPSATTAMLAIILSASVAFAESEDGPTKLEKEVTKAEAENDLEAHRVTRSVRKLLQEKRRLELEAEVVELLRTLDVAKLHASAEKLELQHSAKELEAKMASATLAAKKLAVEMEAETRELETKIALQSLKQETERLTLTNDQLAENLRSQELATMRASVALAGKKLEAELEAEKREHESQIALQSLKQETERLTLTNDQLAENLRAKEMTIQEQQLVFELQTTRLTAELQELELTRTKVEDSLTILQTQLELGDKERELKQRVDRAVAYPRSPFSRGVLRVTDRRIALNGPIIEGTADYITTRIHFFNNRSNIAPIFIIIDRCPGGSVMEGYRIIKAMEASRAPIHVVVKSFAASMAAVILTMADESYAYPNALILHHQPSSALRGNLTQHAEQLRIFEEWAQRLHKPVAKKMGLSLEAFYEKMYERNSDGDWEEFADVAKRLKWVNHIVHEIREEGTDLMPMDAVPEPFWFFLQANGSDETPKGIRLPRPGPFDYYFIYNRSGLYSWVQ